MIKADVQKKHAAFIQELTRNLQGKRRGFRDLIPVGNKIFPYAIPPRLEIQLLSPDDLTIKFRRISDPNSPGKKKGDWHIGKPLDAVADIIDWADTMKKVATQTEGEKIFTLTRGRPE